MHKIIFIDESKDEIEAFLDYVDNLIISDQVEIEYLYPLEDINGLIEQIFESNANAVVTDFMLNEYKEDIDYNVPYNGVELIEKIQAIKDKFPCFVMTSFDKDAVNISSDVNVVYIKEILHGAEEKTDAKSNFIERVVQQILHYQKKIMQSQNELNEIIEKSKDSDLTADEEDKLLYLDDFLEKAINQVSKIPSKLKDKSTLNDLHKLIENTDTLLKKLDEGDNN